MTESTLVAALRKQEESWNSRRLLRALYTEWFGRIGHALSAVDGRSIELGAGIAKLPQTCPTVEPTEIAETPWVSEVVDAHDLHYDDSSLANLVLVDVFHHLASPSRFFDETVRTLSPGGRLVILDPYCSPVSTAAYRLFHHERTDLDADPFEDDPTIAVDPLASNQARATLGFFRHARQFAQRWPQLEIIRRDRLAFLAYPLSGGFGGRRLISDGIGLELARAERALAPLAWLLAFRCLVVVERRA